MVTGASSGIGEAICREVARRGGHVIMVARRENELARIGGEIRHNGGMADWIAADLVDDEQRDRIVATVQGMHGLVDILVSNAGSGWYGPFSEMPWDSAQSLIQLNVIATVRLALSILPDMVAARRGHIITIGSIAGSLPAQGVAIYAATKAFIDSFCRSTYRETRRTGVSVSLVKPGATKTPFFDIAKSDGGRRVPLSHRGISAGRVARRTVGLMRWRRRVLFVPFYLRMIPLVEALFGWFLDLLGPVALKPADQEHRPRRCSPRGTSSRLNPRPVHP